MARSGVWTLQQVRDKLLAGDNWEKFNLYYGWGTNGGGQVGNNTNQNLSSPVQVPGNWDKISRKGVNFTLGVKSGGTLWAMGYNTGGNLGLNDRTSRSSPTQIGSGTDWSSDEFSISSTSMMCAAIKTDNTLWVWGENQFGVLGLNQTHNTASRSSPTQIPGSWAKVSVDTTNVAAIKTDGTLWAWGYNGDKQLGQGASSTHQSSPVQMGSATTWSQVNVGKDWIFSLSNPGLLYHTGKKGEGNAGDGTDSGNNETLTATLPGKSIVSLGVAGESSACVTTDGKLWTWGNNQLGCLGQNNQTQYSSPKQVGSDTTWVKVGSSSYNLYIASKSDGTLWGWGQNTAGDLGQNNRTHYSSPVQIPGTWSNDRTARSWGVGITTGF